MGKGINVDGKKSLTLGASESIEQEESGGFVLRRVVVAMTRVASTLRVGLLEFREIGALCKSLTLWSVVVSPLFPPSVDDPKIMAAQLRPGESPERAEARGREQLDKAYKELLQLLDGEQKKIELSWKQVLQQ